MSETVTYLLKANTDFDNLYITNKPTEQMPVIKYSTERRDAREFNGLDNSVVDMSKHTAIKKVVTETTKYEEVPNG